MCYKPEMRKWMSERLKRRKKEPEKAVAEAAQAPLQPAFYDTEPPHSHPAAEVSQAATCRVAARVCTATCRRLSPQPAPPRHAGNGDVAKRRRRRGRGGRGRGRNGAPPAESATVGSEPGPMQAAPKEGAESSTPASQGRPVTRAASAAPQVEAPRPSKGVVVLAIGLPGSGKSSWFKRHNITPAFQRSVARASV